MIESIQIEGWYPMSLVVLKICNSLLIWQAVFPHQHQFPDLKILNGNFSCGIVSASLISPGVSAGKESACNVGDPGSVPGSGKSPGEGT